jgi:hypothetical protein
MRVDRRNGRPSRFRTLFLALLGAAVVAGCGGHIAFKTTVPATEAPATVAPATVEPATTGPFTLGGGGGGSGGGGGGGGAAAIAGFVNGDFEQGPGVGWLEEPAGLVVPASAFGVSAVSGSNVGWLGYAEDDRRVVRLSQTVAVPPAPVALGFYSWIYSKESCDPPWWDTMGMYANGDPLIVNDRLCDTDGSAGWSQLNSVDISGYAGQTVTFTWEMSSTYGDPLASMVILDDVQFLR